MKHNTKPITELTCHGKALYFKPQSRKEVIAIQKALLELGCAWQSYGKGAEIKHIDECYTSGILVRDGVLYHGPSQEALKNALFCDIRQLPLPTRSKGDFNRSADQMAAMLNTRNGPSRLSQETREKINKKLDQIKAVRAQQKKKLR